MLLAEYRNGNTNVSLYKDGTKIRESPQYEKASPLFPESIDLKITNYCKGAACAAWCHEQSNPRGQHADLSFLTDLVSSIPAGVELAIGGGNPLEYPQLEEFLGFCREKGVIANMTVNASHLQSHKAILDKVRPLVYGLGVSYFPHLQDDIATRYDSNCIVHVIAGIHKIEDVLKLPKAWKLLVLGAKDYGNGPKYYQLRPPTLSAWRYWVGRLMQNRHICFDNLALKQLSVKQWLSNEDWATYYMGDDGTFTMYIDAVEQSFAPSSTQARIKCDTTNIREIFQRALAYES